MLTLQTLAKYYYLKSDLEKSYHVALQALAMPQHLSKNDPEYRKVDKLMNLKQSPELKRNQDQRQKDIVNIIENIR